MGDDWDDWVDDLQTFTLSQIDDLQTFTLSWIDDLQTFTLSDQLRSTSIPPQRIGQTYIHHGLLLKGQIMVTMPLFSSGKFVIKRITVRTSKL